MSEKSREAPVQEEATSTPKKPFANYEPHGLRFFDQTSGREMLFVTEVDHPFNGWLCFRHPDGQWVSQRKATSDDRAALLGITVAAKPSTPSMVAATPLNRNIRTMELANAVANHLGLNPADEIPFDELTRRLWELPPVDGFGSHKADLAELRLLQSWREQAIQDIEALPPACELISLSRMNDQAISKRAVLSIVRGSAP